MNLKAKIYTYVNSTTQRCPKKIIKIFLLEGFFHLPPVSLTPVANLELRISPRIFKKILNSPNGIIRGLGETGSRKKPEAKNLVTLSLFNGTVYPTVYTVGFLMEIHIEDGEEFRRCGGWWYSPV